MNEQNTNNNNVPENDENTSPALPINEAENESTDKISAPAESSAPTHISEAALTSEPTDESEPLPAQTVPASVPEFVTESEPTYVPPQPNYNAASHEKVYIGIKPEETPVKEEKQPKARLGIGSAAVVILLCVLLSGGAAFAGTYFANNMAQAADSDKLGGNTSNSVPSVVFKSYENTNKTIGTYKQVAEVVSPTVVEITTESIATDSLFWGNYVTSGAGSGVIISADGMIVTNNHVVSGANSITVRLSDGTEYPAKVIGTDSDTDIAVVKVEAENLPFALLGNSDELGVGEEVLAVGNPLGELGGTVTNGIISALSREVTISGSIMNLIQMNAEVNPGNSGGGLFNLYGELIGVVNAKSTNTSSGTSVEGIGFAIPINTAAKVADELVNHGYVRGKAALGINYKDITTSYEAMMYRVSALGMYITASNQPDKLKVGDRIVAIDGDDVTYSDDVKAILKGCSVGDVVSVTVVREGRHISVNVTLMEKVPSASTDNIEENNSAFENNFIH